jgi:hypothetical protein
VDSRKPEERLSRQCREDLADMIACFREVNLKIKQEADRNLESHNRTREMWEKKPFGSIDNKYFRDPELETLKLAMRHSAQCPLDRPAELIALAADQSVLGVWNIALESVLEYQGIYVSMEWRQAKKWAFDILDQRNLAAEKFEAVEDELRNNGFDKACRAIRRKFAVLDRFASIYDAQPSSGAAEYQMPMEPFFLFYGLKEWKTNTSESYHSVSNDLSANVVSGPDVPLIQAQTC